MVRRHSPLAMSLFLLSLIVVPVLLALALDFHWKALYYLSPLVLIGAVIYALRAGGGESGGSSSAA